ncbi:MazG nucleotide pyrophosphohydrolase, partial [mine drainage metagenome]
MIWSDKGVTFGELKDVAKALAHRRDWDQYHNAKDLTIGVITEASELFEHFRFKSQEETELMLKDPKKRDKIGAELSDILYFV